MRGYDDDEFVAAVDRYRAAGYFTEPLDGNDLEVLKMATQRNPRLLFERLSLL